MKVNEFINTGLSTLLLNITLQIIKNISQFINGLKIVRVSLIT